MRWKALLGGLALALWNAVALAQSLVVLPQQLVVDVNGDVRSGAKLFTYVSGTTTPLTSYTTPALSAAHPNPVLSVSTGLFPAVYFPDTVTSYKLVLKDSADVTIWTEDNIPAAVLKVYDTTLAETATGVTPTDFDYPEGHSKRYGATCDGVANDTTKIQAAIDVASEAGGTATIQTGTCLVDTLTFDASNFTIRGEGRGSILKASSNIAADCAILVSLAGGADEATNQALLDTACPGIDVRTNAPNSLENVRFLDFAIEGNANAIRGIWATGFTRGSSMERLFIENTDGCGIALNGSWSFTLLNNYLSGDNVNGTGMCLGITGNGTRDAQLGVNAPFISGNQISRWNIGVIWNLGSGGFFGGNIVEITVSDGFQSQTANGITFVGNYLEANGGDAVDIGGTNGTDFVEGWIVAGNYSNQATGQHFRIDGVERSQLGPNDIAGAITQHFAFTVGGGQYTTANQIWVPDTTSTYITNPSELDTTDNVIYRNAAATYIFSAPELLAITKLRTAASSTLCFFNVTCVAQQSAIAALTDSTGGTADDTLAAVSGSGADATINNNFADIAADIAAFRAMLRAYGLLP